MEQSVTNKTRCQDLLLLAAELLPKPAGRNGSGRGHQAEASSETEWGGSPTTAEPPDDTTTPANAPTYTPEHPEGAKSQTHGLVL